MIVSQDHRRFAYYRNTTFASLLLGYASYYLCRQNLSAAYAPMKTALGISTVQFGSLTSFGTLLYAFGKLTTGAVADSRFGGRNLFFIGLFGSALLSVFFGLSSGMGLFLAIWGANRFFQSMGWGGLVNVMARWFPARSYGTAMGFMSISYQFGGVLASLFAGLILALGGGWRALFIIPGIVLLILGFVLQPFLKNSPEDVGESLPSFSTENHPAKSTEVDCLRHEDELTYWQRFQVLLGDRAFLLMVGLSFILTFLRECFNTWTPTLFSMMGASASAAAFKSAVFPLLGCVGTLFAGWFSDRFFNGRRGPVMAGLLLGLIASLLALSQLTSLAAWINVTPSRLATGLVALIGFFLLGPYSLVGGVVALDFGGRKTSGTAAGLLDGAGYLAASLAGVGVAEFLVHAGWSQAFGIMAVLGALAIVLCGLLWQVRPRN
ncbi:MFS transporter [Bdellovibrionota bacterium FG-1]